MQQKLTVSEQLRIIRARRGLTLAEMSERVGIHSGVLRRIENGKTSPRVNTLEKIASALGWPLEISLSGFTLASVSEDSEDKGE